MATSPFSADLIRWIDRQAWQIARYGLPRSLEVCDVRQEGCLGALCGYEQAGARGLANGARWAMRSLVRRGWYQREQPIVLPETMAAPERGDLDLCIDLSNLFVRILTPAEERIVAGYHLYDLTWAEITATLGGRWKPLGVERRYAAAMDRLHRALDPSWSRPAYQRKRIGPNATERFRAEMAERRRVAAIIRGEPWLG